MTEAIEPDLPWVQGGARIGGLECDEGWWPIIAKLHEDLVVIDPDYQVVQVKEKFGGLRYYTFSTAPLDIDSPFQARISEAEQEAARTCEVCGEPGQTRNVTKYYIRTVCDQHAEPRKL